jgi:hypothetical protein
MAMVRIHGRQRRKNWKIKRDIDNYRTDGGTLETVDHSYYVETGEKVMYNTGTKEVRIR